DIEYMLLHPVVKMFLHYYRSGIAGAEFDIKCESPEIGKFAEEQLKRFWDRGVPLLQFGDEYGWIAAENIFCDENDDGILKWDSLKTFAPRDTYLLTQSSKPVGVRVKHLVQYENGKLELWFTSTG